MKHCLFPYRAARDEIKAKRCSNAHTRTRQKQTDRNLTQFANPAQQALFIDGESDSPTSSSTSSNTLSTTISDSYSGDVSEDERILCLSTQQQVIRGTYREKSRHSPLRIVVPLVLTSRQIENKKLIANHNNINKKLSASAQIRHEAAQRTKLWIQETKLVRQTESNRPMNVCTFDNVTYTETADTIEYKNGFKKNESAKLRAVLMLNESKYHGKSRIGFA